MQLQIRMKKQQKKKKSEGTKHVKELGTEGEYEGEGGVFAKALCLRHMTEALY